MKLKIEYLNNYNRDWDNISSKDGDSGYDLRAAIAEPIELTPGSWQLIPVGIKVQLDTADYYTVVKNKATGITHARFRGKVDIKDLSDEDKLHLNVSDPNKELYTEIEEVNSIGSNVEIQVRPRSGIAFKKGISIMNTPGTVDYSYKGEVGVILVNHGTETFVVHPGDRIAQMVVCPIYKPEIEEVDAIDLEGDRGGGFGHSGTK